MRKIRCAKCQMTEKTVELSTGTGSHSYTANTGMMNWKSGPLKVARYVVALVRCPFILFTIHYDLNKYSPSECKV